MAALPRTSDVIVVGGGAAGIAAARTLAAAGVEVLLLEAGDRLGGRVRTDRVDGFRIDRGFQVVNTAYPALRRLVDVDRLDLRLFDHAVLVADGSGRHLLADPRHHPTRLASMLDAPVPYTGLVRLGALSARLGYADAGKLLTETETDARDQLARWLDPRTLSVLVEPFLTGVFGYQPLTTSSRVLDMIWRSFVRGRIGVPATGMSRLVELLAEPLPGDLIRLDTPVTAVDGSAVRTRDGTARARYVVVATDPATAARLLPALAVPAERELVTFYHATVTPPLDRPVLLLDGTRRTGIANSVVLTQAAPEYAPPGLHLVATTVPAEAGLDEPAVRHGAGALYGVDTDGWRHVETVAARPGVVAAPPPRGRLRERVAVTDTVFVAGDHRDSPSLQGALVSGERAARAVLGRSGAGEGTT